MELVPIDPQLIELINGSFGQSGELQPFVQEILLLECHVAGTSHIPSAELEPELDPGKALVLQREPENTHDSLAIRIVLPDGRKLGYVPRDRNEVLARLMDAGKLLFGKLESKRWRGNWLYLKVTVYMRDW